MATNFNLDREITPQVMRRFTSPQPIPVGDLWLQPCVNEAGSRNLNVNGSGTPVSFRAVVPPGNDFLMTRVNGFFAAPGLIPASGAALTNGTRVAILNAAGETVFGGVTAFRAARDWSILAGCHQFLWPVASGTLLAFEWPIGALGMHPYLPSGFCLEVLVRDDLSGLTDFQVTMTGRLVRK